MIDKLPEKLPLDPVKEKYNEGEKVEYYSHLPGRGWMPTISPAWPSGYSYRVTSKPWIVGGGFGFLSPDDRKALIDLLNSHSDSPDSVLPPPTQALSDTPTAPLPAASVPSQESPVQLTLDL